MRNRNGFTLLELQISALMMVAVLVATGVIFYFALASIRYMHDGFYTYSNALSAMKVITKEVMLSNCYGSESGVFIGGAGPTYDLGTNEWFYGVDGYVHDGGGSGNQAHDVYNIMPHLNGSDAEYVTDGTYGSGLYLRQAVASGISGTPSVAGDFPSHEHVMIYRAQNNADPSNIVDSLYIERSPGGGGPIKIADNVIRFAFTPLAYNSVHVELIVEGLVDDPIGGVLKKNRIRLNKQITLRCAPAVTPIPTNDTW